MEEITNNDWNIKQDIGSILSVEIDSIYNYLLDLDSKKLYCFMNWSLELPSIDIIQWAQLLFFVISISSPTYVGFIL